MAETVGEQSYLNISALSLQQSPPSCHGFPQILLQLYQYSDQLLLLSVFTDWCLPFFFPFLAGVFNCLAGCLRGDWMGSGDLGWELCSIISISLLEGRPR